MPGPTPKIAIIGAGPAGTMLARLLHQASIPCVVFEGEPSPDYRSQGGTLDLHTSTGLVAIKEAGLWGEFLEKARYKSDLLQICDQDLNVVFRKQGPPAPKPDGAAKGSELRDQRPEIDRSDLRQLLVQSLPEGTIRWGAHLRRVEEDGTLVFAHGTETGFDLVVGADGAWSKVRALLTDVKPECAGVAYHELSIQDPERNAPELHKATRGGNLFAHATGRKLTSQQMGDGSLHVGVCVQTEDERWMDHCGYDPHDLAQTRQAMIGPGGPFADWHPALRDAVGRANGFCRPRALWQLPVGVRWAHRRGATLVGDAAHLMTPFAGEGVNLALEDALRLSREIVAAVRAHPAGGPAQLDALDAAVASYEREMWPRTERVARLTDDLRKLWMYTPDTPRSVLQDMIARHAKHHVSRYLYPFARAGISSYFLGMKLLKGNEGVIIEI